ncbi:MAG: IS1 family transposase [Pyrinomonadaceae bacterium]
MSNYFLAKDKQIAVTAALAEGNSIRSIERMTGIHRDTIMRLGVRIGQGCAKVLDRKMRGLDCKSIQVDEIWGFVGKKDKQVKDTDDPNRVGSVWTFCAIDSDTKIVPSYRVGKRDHYTANAFMDDLGSRLNNRIQLASDGFAPYFEAVELTFGSEVDYGQIVKSYQTDEGKYTPERKYSAPRFVSVSKYAVTGNPDLLRQHTSHVERLNATTRLHMKRMNRLTLAFSKKIENFEAAVALHFCAYNFVRRHASLRMTPAMAAGIERNFWSWGDMVEAAL